MDGQPVAFVTGGAAGIGRGIAVRLAARGMEVVVADVDGEGARRTAAEVGGRAMRMDVAEPAAWRAVTAALGPRLDVAVLNAGIATGEADVTAVSDETYRAVMGVNVDGVVLGARALLPLLRARPRSWLLATASMAGLTAVPFDPVYAASKHAVVGFVRSLAAQVAGAGVTVQALCPSFADTAIVTPAERARFAAAGLDLVSVEHVVDTAMAALDSDGTGEAWVAQLGRPPLTYAFRGVPGARAPDGSPVVPPVTWTGDLPG